MPGGGRRQRREPWHADVIDGELARLRHGAAHRHDDARHQPRHQGADGERLRAGGTSRACAVVVAVAAVLAEGAWVLQPPALGGTGTAAPAEGGAPAASGQGHAAGLVLDDGGVVAGGVVGALHHGLEAALAAAGRQRERCAGTEGREAGAAQRGQHPRGARASCAGSARLEQSDSADSAAHLYSSSTDGLSGWSL